MSLASSYTEIVVANDEGRIRILIIDKHEAVRRALRIRLSVPNHLEVVGTFSDPDTAVFQKVALKPDVIILGLQNASNEDLYKTALAVRELVTDSAVVIALAPYIDAIERELLLQAGAKRYLLKHINSKELIREIELCTPSLSTYH
ncbi:MAG: response regulator [Candidatus Promineifilaceae bacterium]|nr:response regulator [Candidatus Promineifilaceae bacterium]